MKAFISPLILALTACGQAQSSQNLTSKNSSPQKQNIETTASPQSAPSACLVAGQWVNDRGSAVTLSCEGAALSGVYNTNVGEPDKGQSFPLTGWAQGDNVSFTVNFGGYGSITAWVGQVELTGGQEQLKTLWHLTRDIDEANEADDMWKSVTAGASIFTRVD